MQDQADTHGQAPLLELADALGSADHIVIGAGAGLSTSAGFEYGGERFLAIFGDFAARYGFRDMYSAGFFPFPTPEEQWAFWSRNIWHNRYVDPPKDTYRKLLRLVDGRDHFVITTNVDHQFQRAGFDKQRLFYTQGDYGLWQCSVPCHDKTYDNYETVKRMVAEQEDLRVPAELIPRCPVCGEPMSMNLRADETFVEDAGWHEAAGRYRDFIMRVTGEGAVRTLFLELGVGGNTPGIIKYPFWQMTAANPEATYACLNYGEAVAPKQILSRSILVDGDIDGALAELLAIMQPS